MSDPMNIDSAVPSGQPAIEERPHPQMPPPVTSHADPQLISVLASMQNDCFTEMGYYPTLLREHLELQKTCAMLSTDNQKLYADNRALAQLLSQQDQRLKLLQTPEDQQKQSLAQLHEQVRKLTKERDDIAGRLHSAFDEIVMLRQELSRSMPQTMVTTSRERGWPGSNSQPHLPVQSGRVPVSHAAIQPHVQPVMQANARFPPNSAQYRSVPPALSQAKSLPQGRPLHSPLQHHPPMPIRLQAINTSMPPNISQHRLPSAPTPLALPQSGLGSSTPSASPLNNFSGLNLGSLPATPIPSRPGTASGSSQPYSWTLPSRPSSRGLHVAPAQNISSSSLAGAIIHLTNDDVVEENARKRRKLEHTLEVPSSQSAPSPIVPVSSGTSNGDVSPRQTIVAQQLTVTQTHVTAPPQAQPTNALVPSTHSPQPQAVASQTAPARAPPHQFVSPSQSAPVRSPQSQPVASAQPTSVHLPHPQSIMSSSAAPAHHPQMQVSKTPFSDVQPLQPQYAQPQFLAHTPPHPPQSQYVTASRTVVPAPQQPRPSAILSVTDPQPPINAPTDVHVDPTSTTTTHQPTDAIMADAQTEQQQQTTVEEDCIEANFDEDDEDETKLWCRMCCSRYKGGHTTEPPIPFIGASQQQLVEHCETVHPRGWETLTAKVAEQRAAEGI